MKWLVIGLALVSSYGFYWVGTNLFFLETAPYSVRLEAEPFEVREYPDLAVVRTEMSSVGDDTAFQKLFRFIQGENSRDEKISMTTPVFVDEKVGKGDMSFVVPQETIRQGAPDPNDTSVMVETREATLVAVYRFSGNATEDLKAEALQKLRTWMVDQDLEPSGEPTFAYYDAPFIPGPLRRNEVMLRIEN